MAEILTALHHHGHTHGQFEPGNTLILEDVVCRLTGTPWPSPDARTLTHQDLQQTAKSWQPEDPIHCWWHAPLRLTKPAGEKGLHRYADEAYFRENPTAPDHLAQTLGLSRLRLDPAHCFGTWLDVTYGRTTKSTSLMA